MVSGWGVGYLADHFGWGAAFGLLVGCCVVTALLFAITWNVGTAAEEAIKRINRRRGFAVVPGN